jgi:hypothetical protein
MTTMKEDRLGTVYRNKATGTIIIRSLNRYGHPGWTAIYHEPDPNPHATYFYYDPQSWNDFRDCGFERLDECIVGAP